MPVNYKHHFGFFVIILILLAGIIVSQKLFFRIDLTDDRRFTLSNATQVILSELKESVKIRAYFSKELPPDIARVKDEFIDFLVEYSKLSNGNITFEFINPNENKEAESEAQRAGIAPVIINVRERDQIKQQLAYLGAVVQFRDKQKVIPLIQNNSSIEYELSSAIKEISNSSKKKIAFLHGQRETNLTEIPQLLEQLNVLYDLDTISLHNKMEIPSQIKAIIIASPQDSIDKTIEEKLDAFISSGGRVLFALNKINGDFSSATGININFGLDKLLSKLNVRIEDKLIIDASCSSVMVRQQQGNFIMNTPINFPYIPIATKFADHPVASGVEAVVFPFISPIVILKKNPEFVVKPIVFSSEKSEEMKMPINFDITKNWNENDFTKSSLLIGVSIENTVSRAKVVLFSDGDFFVNGVNQQSQQLQPDNINLVSNAIDWLCDDTGLIELRTKGVSTRPINSNLDETSKNFIKYSNFILPIFLIILFGFFRYRKNHRSREILKNTFYAKNEF